MTLPLSVQQTMIDSGVWQTACPIAIDRLKLLEIQHYTLKGDIMIGQMVVLDVIATSTRKIFASLFARKFPIHKIQPMDTYNGNDDAAMEDNNSSCFNFRKISGSDRLSIHSYGLAIDVNPLQNPCIINNKISPTAGREFTDRNNIRPGMLEPVVHLFKQYGFEWGGDWTNLKDYHHFQVSLDILN